MTPTAIEWTEETWNPVTGCTKVSPGCDHCYAERITERFHGKGSFDHVITHPERLEKPLHWRKPRTVFVNSMSDLFHGVVPAPFISRVFAVMAKCPQHTFQILTKRPGRARMLLKGAHFSGRGMPLPNVWLGVSVENQEQADKRIPLLLDTPAAVRFVSCEPLLGPVSFGDLDNALEGSWLACRHDSRTGDVCDGCGDPHERKLIDWVIVGGESGPKARPMAPAWARHLRLECREAGVPFFFKQWGEFRPGHLLEPHVVVDSQLGHSSAMVRCGKKEAGRVLDGATWDEMPARVTS